MPAKRLLGRLERRILLVAAASLLPMAVLACGVLIASAMEQKRRLLDAHEQTMLALITAVDGELRSSISALQAFAARPRLAAGDFAALQVEARLLLSQQPTWLNLVISHPDSQQVMNARLPEGAPLPRGISPEAVRAAAETRRPQVGNVIYSPVLRTQGVAVHVPFLQDGVTRYVLTAAVRPEAFLSVLSQQHVPHTGVIGVLDQSLNFVTRSLESAQWVGRQPSPGLVRLINEKKIAGWDSTMTLEGVPAYSVFRRSDFSGWTAAVAVPASVVDAPLHRSYVMLAAAVAFSALLGLWAAFFAGRTIVRPIRELEQAAALIGRGQALEKPHTDLPEIAAVGTALVAAQAERERVFTLEHEARKSAEANSKQKDEFLAMLGHELRNPLAAISSATLLLTRDQLSPRAANAAAIVQRQTRNLARLTDDLLDAGRVILGKIALAPVPLDLAAVVPQVVEVFRNSGRLDRHEVTVQLQPAWVNADPTRLEQIITNILANAIRYTPEGGRIDIRVWSGDAGSFLEVQDSGIGIDPELLPRVFDLFVQGERALDRTEGGLGIGLTLVKRLAELHGGRIEARSAGRSQGSTFSVMLPAAAPGQAQPVAADTGATAARILLVEDNDDARTSLAALLEAQGHVVLQAADGHAGLEMLRRHPDLQVALLDIGLPGLSGLEIARSARAELGDELCCIAMSGYGSGADRQAGIDAGFDEYLVKPVDIAVLLRVIAVRGRAKQI